MTPRFWLPLILCFILFGCSNEGATVYKKNCAGCHKGGLAGAPALGDVDAWKERIARGEKALVTRSIQGYSGEAGIMPARGGNPNLTDEEVRAAVIYLIERSR